jgi:hypothetical protein
MGSRRLRKRIDSGGGDTDIIARQGTAADVPVSLSSKKPRSIRAGVSLLRGGLTYYDLVAPPITYPRPDFFAALNRSGAVATTDF